MRTPYVDPEEEDLTGQAGWMYTDLMLALMVVFLATISFVPQFMGSGSAAITDPNDPNYSYSKVFDESMNTLYEGFSLSQIKADIARFKSSNGLPQDADIVYAQYVGGYSSGSESPSAAIARALASNPKVLLADEPTGALDTVTSYEVMELIQGINDEGKTILIVTHEPDIAAMCKRNVVLKDGIIIDDKYVEQVRASSYV